MVLRPKLSKQIRKVEVSSPMIDRYSELSTAFIPGCIAKRAHLAIQITPRAARAPTYLPILSSLSQNLPSFSLSRLSILLFCSLGLPPLDEQHVQYTQAKESSLELDDDVPSSSHSVHQQSTFRSNCLPLVGAFTSIRILLLRRRTA